MPLSARQVEVLILYSRGLTAAQISTLLFIEESTVKCHYAQMRGRLGAKTMGRCLMIALARGYVEVDEDAECARLPTQDLVAA